MRSLFHSMLLRSALAAAILSMALPAVPAASAEKLNVLTSWYAQAEHGGFYQAKATGRYDKAGVDVTLKMGGPQIHGIQLLVAGEVDAIMGYDLQVLQAVERDLPVVAVAATFQHDLQGLMTHDDIKSLADLKNKNKTVLVSTSGRTTWWPWMVGKFGLSEEQLRVYTFNLQPFFADPNVATSAYPSSEPFQAQLKGMPARFYLLADAGYPPYGATIVTTRKVLDTKRQALQAFVTASMEGWRDYMDNPGPGNALIKADNPKMSDGQIAFGIAKMREIKVLDSGGKVPIGTMTEARWQATTEFLVSIGQVKPSVDWRKAFTLDLVRDLKTTLQ